MGDAVDQARSDLAFMRAVAEDRGALPALMGWHLIAVGSVFGLAFVHIWGVYTGRFAWPDGWESFLWLPGVLLFLPVNAWLSIRGRGTIWGPGAAAFGAAWAAMAAMIPPALAVLFLAEAELGLPFYKVWPALAFVLYGGAWSLAAIARRRWWHAAVGFGCFIVAILCAALIRETSQWLVMAAGLLAFVAFPGALIVRRARR